MAERAGRQILDAQLVAAEGLLEWILSNPYLRNKIVVDQPGADLDTAAAAAVQHLEQAREMLAPFFLLDYVVGDVVDVVEVSERTGKERIELAGATVVEIRGESSSADAVVEDADGARHLVAGFTVRKRDTD